MDAYRWALLAGCIFGISANLLFVRRHSNYLWSVLCGPALWLAHIALFQIQRLILIPALTNVEINMWAVIIQMHGVALLIAAPLIYMKAKV